MIDPSLTPSLPWYGGHYPTHPTPMVVRLFLQDAQATIAHLELLKGVGRRDQGGGGGVVGFSRKSTNLHPRKLIKRNKSAASSSIVLFAGKVNIAAWNTDNSLLFNLYSDFGFYPTTRGSQAGRLPVPRARRRLNNASRSRAGGSGGGKTKKGRNKRGSGVSSRLKRVRN